MVCGIYNKSCKTNLLFSPWCLLNFSKRSSFNLAVINNSYFVAWIIPQGPKMLNLALIKSSVFFHYIHICAIGVKCSNLYPIVPLSPKDSLLNWRNAAFRIAQSSVSLSISVYRWFKKCHGARCFSHYSVMNCTFWLLLYSIRYFPMHSPSVMHHSFSLFPNTFSLLLSVNVAHASLWALAASEIPWLRSQNPDSDFEYCGGILSAIVVWNSISCFG